MLTRILTVSLLIVSPALRAGDVVQVREDFSSDPRWEGHNNTPSPSDCVTTIQDFGYRATDSAGGAPGGIGGRISRSLTKASYARVVPGRSLEDRLTASGRLAVTHAEGGSGVLVGWFNSRSRGWRTPNALVFRIDGESGSYRIFFEYGTRTWKTGGGRTFEGRWQTTKTPPLVADGTPHTWVLDYDPDGADGRGEMTFVLDGKVFRAPLGLSDDVPHRHDGAVFDRFGILNQMISGNGLTLWLDDVVIDGSTQDLDHDPGWEEVGNRRTFRDCGVRPVHDFGFRETRRAGGRVGEIGGIVWRIESTRPENAFSYGTPVGRLSLEDRLTASGRISMHGAAADSAVLLGWFNSRTAIGAPPDNFVGVLVEGPSRIGHYFRPTCGTSDDLRAIKDRGPLLRPDGTTHEWTLTYTPGEATGGRIEATLDGASVTLDLDAALRKGNAAFDRFGVLSWHRGGHFVEIYLDDLVYSSRVVHGR